jgi:drug/metabolite transporter (DMT)-like permease
MLKRTDDRGPHPGPAGARQVAPTRRPVQRPAPTDYGAKPTVVAQSAPKAITLILLAVTFFAGIDATAKYLVLNSNLPMTQIVWVRFLGQFLTIVLAIGLVSVPRLLRSSKPIVQIIRSALLLSATVFNFIALKYLRLDQTTTIQFLAPLTVALLAGPFLGEWVGWRRMIAIFVGFGGVLVAVRPGIAAFEPAFLLAFGCMLSYSLFTLLTRYLAPHDSSETTLFYSLIVGTALVAPFALVDWVTPEDGFTVALMIGMGLCGGIGHWLFIVAYRYAPAPAVTPFTYFSLVTYATAGYLVFGHVPDAWTIGGASIVIASGLYLWWRERVRARELSK